MRNSAPATACSESLAAGALAIAGSLAGVALCARIRAPFEPVLERIEIDFGRQRRGILPLKVGFVTDTHVGPVMSGHDVARAVSLLFAERPDVLLLGGDYICESPRYIPEAVAVLGDFATQPRLGAFAVLGNLDYANDASRLISRFEQRGIRVLQNESVNLCRGMASIRVVGIDDALLGRPDLDMAFAPLTDETQAIALWHEPDWAEHSARRGASLQLSGHSHGGQIRLPLLGPIAAPSGGRKFVAGLNQVRGMPIYTARGVGVYRPPMRFHCRPEVTLVTLQ
jgi:predicted MPP superfamily phosphohydrolase